MITLGSSNHTIIAWSQTDMSRLTNNLIRALIVNNVGEKEKNDRVISVVLLSNPLHCVYITPHPIKYNQLGCLNQQLFSNSFSQMLTDAPSWFLMAVSTIPAFCVQHKDVHSLFMFRLDKKIYLLRCSRPRGCCNALFGCTDAAGTLLAFLSHQDGTFDVFLF